jgi:hypothetical protein
LNNLTILIIATFRGSVIEVLAQNSDKEKIFWTSFHTLTKKSSFKLAKQAVKMWETEVNQYHTSIQEKLVNWIMPYIQTLALAYMANPTYTLKGVTEAELIKRFSKDTIQNCYWFKQLELIDEELANRDPEFAKLKKELRELEKKQATEDVTSKRKRKQPAGNYVDKGLL